MTSFVVLVCAVSLGMSAFPIRNAKAAGDEYSLWTVDDFEARPAVAIPTYPSPARQIVSLDGVWQAKTDPQGVGFAERWFERQDVAFDADLTVPGNWNAQGLGGAGVPHDEGVSWPDFGLRSAELKGSYVGLAWYRRSMDVPADWQDKQVRIVFGGVLSSVRLWVNGQFVGGRWTDGNSFYFDVTQQISPGRTNSFVTAIDSRWDQTATVSHLHWYVAAGGPFHHIALCALPRVHIDEAVVRPTLDVQTGSGTAEVHVSVANDSGSDKQVNIDVNVASLQDPGQVFQGSTGLTIAAGQTGKVVVPVSIDQVQAWSCDSPNLYKLTVNAATDSATDSVMDRFGMRTVASVGNRLELNGRPTFILGQHFNFFWPNAFTPPITKQDYLNVLGLMKDYGFNYLRTPWLMPEECYQAADELGMMLQLEFPYAFDPYSEIKPQLVERLIAECLSEYGNHPSLAVLCMSNEGSWDGRGDLNPRFFTYSKSLDPSRVVIDTDGMPESGDVTYSEIASLTNHSGVWSDYMANLARQSDIYRRRPCIDHEFLNVPSLYNPEDVNGYHDPVLSPPTELVPARQEQIRRQGMEAEYPQYLQAGYHHQANFIKEGMERSRKNPLKAGYSMTAWNDIGAGVHWGILDQFMNPKGITAAEMRVYNAQSVLLFDFIDPTTGQVELVPDYCRSYEQPFTIQPCVSYWNRSPVTDAVLTWRVETASGQTLAQGTLEHIEPIQYTVTTLPRIVVGPTAGAPPQEVTLRMTLSGSGVQLENSWPLWLFPKLSQESVGRKVFASKNVIATLQRVAGDVAPAKKGVDNDPSSLWVTDDPALALEWLGTGKEVLFLAKGLLRANPFDPGWFKGDDHTGTLVRANGLLGDFPHKGYASWQFRNLIDRAADVPEGQISATCVVTSALGESWPHIQHQLLAARTGAGGHLTYCLLKVLSGRHEADYLLLQLLKNARRVETDPVMTDNELAAFIPDDGTGTWENALQFDGADDCAVVPDTAKLPLGNAPYTQEVWVNIAQYMDYPYGVNGTILSRGDEGFGLGNHIFIINHHIWLTHWIPDRDTDVTLALGEWHHLATTWDGTAEKLYVDGELAWFQSWGGPLAVAGGSLTFGKHDNVDSYYLNGLLREARIWNVARTADQIRENYACPVPADSPGLVGYWKLDEDSDQTVPDSSSSGHNGTLGSSAAAESSDPLRVESKVLYRLPAEPPVGPAEYWGNALHFDGSRDFAFIADAAALPVGNAPYTQELWVNIAQYMDYGSGYNGAILSRGDEGSRLANNMFVVNHRVWLTHWMADWDTGVALPLGEWRHLAATWDGATEKLYLDGQPAWSSTWGGPLAVAGGSVTFGKHNNVDSYYLNGRIDEVRVWNVARTAEEIGANYRRTVPSDSPGLVAYWKFDESMGQTLFDSCGGNSATRGKSSEYEYKDPCRVLSTIPFPSIGEVKAAGPGWSGAVTGIVTAVFPDYDSFVIEAEDRSSAITVKPLAPYASQLSEGLEGVVPGAVQGDGTLLAADLWLSGRTKTVAPLGMANKHISGGAGGGDPSNADMLVATWGAVLDAPRISPDDGSTRFRITDGSDASGLGVDAVEVVIPRSVSGAPQVRKNDYVRVVGIAGSVAAPGSIMVRKADDLMKIIPAAALIRIIGPCDCRAWSFRGA